MVNSEPTFSCWCFKPKDIRLAELVQVYKYAAVHSYDGAWCWWELLTSVMSSETCRTWVSLCSTHTRTVVSSSRPCFNLLVYVTRISHISSTNDGSNLARQTVKGSSIAKIRHLTHLEGSEQVGINLFCSCPVVPLEFSRKRTRQRTLVKKEPWIKDLVVSLTPRHFSIVTQASPIRVKTTQIITPRMSQMCNTEGKSVKATHKTCPSLWMSFLSFPFWSSWLFHR